MKKNSSLNWLTLSLGPDAIPAVRNGWKDYVESFGEIQHNLDLPVCRNPLRRKRQKDSKEKDETDTSEIHSPPPSSIQKWMLRLRYKQEEEEEEEVLQEEEAEGRKKERKRKERTWFQTPKEKKYVFKFIPKRTFFSYTSQ